MERNLPQGSRQWCGHQKFKVLGYRNPSTAISQFRRAAACPKRGQKAALPHKIWLAFFSSMQTLRLVLLERCTVSWVRLIFRSPPASTQGIKSLLYLSQFWRHICCQPPEARDWPKTPEKKGCNLHIPSYHCCSNVYVFIYKTNIHGQVILDFSREKNDMKSSPTSQRVQAGTWATITEMSMQLTSFSKCCGCPALPPEVCFFLCVVIWCRLKGMSPSTELRQHWNAFNRRHGGSEIIT